MQIDLPNNFVSSDSFPGVAEFIQDVLSTDKEDFIRMLWNHEKRLTATGTTRTFMDIICYTLTDFSSNCKQPMRNSNNHERTPFVKYIVPMFKYLSQESNLTELYWCEKMIGSQGLAVSESNDFVISFSDRKYADGLGRNTTTNSEDTSYLVTLVNGVSDGSGFPQRHGICTCAKKKTAKSLLLNVATELITR